MRRGWICTFRHIKAWEVTLWSNVYFANLFSNIRAYNIVEQFLHMPCIFFARTLLFFFFPLFSLSLTSPPSLPKPILSSKVLPRVRDVWSEKMFPHIKKAPGFWVDVSKRRKRSSWIQWVRRERWGQSWEWRWLIPAERRLHCWKEGRRERRRCFVLYLLLKYRFLNFVQCFSTLPFFIKICLDYEACNHAGEEKQLLKIIPTRHNVSGKLLKDWVDE